MVAFDEAVIRDVLELAQHRDDLVEGVEAASEPSTAAASKHEGKQVRFSPDVAERIVTALQNLSTLQRRLLDAAREEGPGQLVPEEVWVAERVGHALLTLREVVDVGSQVRGGTPVLRGTRFTV